MSRTEKFLWHAAAVIIGAVNGAVVGLVVGGGWVVSALAGSTASLLFFVQPWKRRRA